MQLREYVERRKAKALKPSKYRNKPTTVGGIRFASKAEARRWPRLQAMQRSGAIANLKRQPKFELVVNGVKIATYVADYSYTELFFLNPGKDKSRLGEFQVIEDIKGLLTADCRLKLKLMEACHGIKVQLLTKKTNPELFR